MKNTTFVTFVLAGIIGGTSFLNAQSAWMIIIFAILIVYGIERSSSWKEAAVGTYVAGCLKTGIATSWMLTGLPFDWLLDAPLVVQFIPFSLVWFGLIFSIGAGTLIAGVLLYFLKEKRYLKYIAIILFILIADICGAFIFSIYTLGPGHGVNIHYGYSMYGYVLADHGIFFHGARFGGLFVLSLILGLYISISYFLNTQLVKRGFHSTLLYSILFFIITSFTPNVFTDSPALTAPVASIETHYLAQRDVSIEDVKLRQRFLMEAIKEASKIHPSIILLPESAGLTAFKSPYRILEDLNNLGTQSIVVDTTNTALERGGTVQRSYIYDTMNDQIFTTEKKFSIAIGEYVPYFHNWVGKILAGRDAIAKFANQERSSLDISSDASRDIPTVLFCSESASPTLAYSRYKNRDTRLLVHPVSHSWFRSPHSLWNQERQMLKVHSLFVGVPILQAGNESNALLFTPDGRVTSGNTQHINEFVDVVVFGG